MGGTGAGIGNGSGLEPKEFGTQCAAGGDGGNGGVGDGVAVNGTQLMAVDNGIKTE